MKHTLAALAALLLVLPAQAQDKPKEDHSFSVSKNLDIFNTLYRKLDLFYVDTLDAEKVILTGIDAMLESLDPYTEYYADEDLGDLKMMTTGKYGGIGAMIRMRKDSTVIIGEPYEGMPAAEVGLKVGDILRKIDATDLKGKSVSDVSDMLRGEPGTTFVLRIQRPGEKKTRDFRITRRNIKVEPIPYYGLNGTIGYICLTQFTDKCSADVRRAVISLKEQGAQSLVIDLRGNGGGLLSEAVNIVGLFVPKGLTIVETKGKVKAANSQYATTTEPLDTITPLVVLVNGSTASAAEIVAGSLQDLDRAVVVGSRTYGKGLVQSPQELPFNGQLKLTTSKYYIPSGRCIQAYDYRHLNPDGSVGTVPDSLTRVFHTAHGREVRDGGGIKPDIEVRPDSLASIIYDLVEDDAFFDFATLYTSQHPTIAPAGEFSLSDADYEQFVAYIAQSGFTYNRRSDEVLELLKKVARREGYYDVARAEFDALEARFSTDLEADLRRHRKDIEPYLCDEIVQRYYYEAGAVKQQLVGDACMKQALQLLADPQRLDSILRPQTP